MCNLKIKNILIVTICLFTISSCFATPTQATTMDEVISQGDAFLSTRNEQAVIDEQALSETSNTVYNILFTIAVVLAIAIGMIIGIQFIMGSVEEQAKVKETLVPYVIGVFVVFSAFTIWKIAVNIGNEMSPTLENTSYTITKNGSSTSIKCNSCNKYCHYNTAPEQCPHCGNYFTDGYTTKTQIDNYTYRCDYCNNTYNPLNWRNNNCPSCGKNFK